MVIASEAPQLTVQRREAVFNLAKRFHERIDPILSEATAELLKLPPCDVESEPFGSTALAPAAAAGDEPPSHNVSPIIGLLTPDPHALSAFLLERGYVVRPVVPPTVPPGGQRVRICLRAEMGSEVVDGLVAALQDWVQARKGCGHVGRTIKSTRPALALMAKL